MGSATSKSVRKLPKTLPKEGGVYRPVQDLGDYDVSSRAARLPPRTGQGGDDQGVRDPSGKSLSESIAASLKDRATEARRPIGYNPASGAASNRPDASTVADQGRDSYIDQDGKDPQFLQMLRGVGPVRFGEPDAGRKAGLAASGHAATSPTKESVVDTRASNRSDPLDGMWRARERLAAEVARENGEDGDGTNTPTTTTTNTSGTATTTRRHLEMSEIVAILDARKRGQDLAAVARRFNASPDVIDRLGSAVNTVTQIGETDDNGNAKAEWRDRV